MSLINSFTHIQENWKFVIICVQNQWGVVHPWHGTVAKLWGRHKDFTEFNENFEKSYLLNGLSNIVKFCTVWFLKIFCIKWIHIFFWVQCSFNTVYIILVKYILYIRFQKYCLICTSDWAHKKLQYFNGEFHSLVIGDFCERIIPPWDLQVPFTYIIGSPAILYL